MTVALPPSIARLDYVTPPELISELENAGRAITALDAGPGQVTNALGGFLLRTESVASSKIEYIEASTDDYARALVGIRANENATSMVAATRALAAMIDSAGSGTITLRSILEAHEILMHDDAFDGQFAGKLRTQQNWIGGSDYSPLGAIHVPPPPGAVADYMDDLLEFANRDDVPVIAQAAITHAQFESIHPFTDGNGRIGRGLINAIIRRRGLTTTTVSPIATAMAAQRQEYFDLVNSYRDGHIDPFVRSLAQSARIASRAGQLSALAFAELPALWETLTRPRKGSATAKIIDQLLDHPVLSAEDAVRLTGASSTSAYEAMRRLERDGVVHEVTSRQRDKVWAASEVLAELDRLSSRIADEVRKAR
ncbi:Fic family protein [Leifsonia poae]|uniref:Fic family protein n=1 Tax=Leifsonia poae TaxID=110933 RepID=UPI003D664F5C